MDLRLNEDQEMIRDSARELFAAECSSSLVREMEIDPLGHPPQLWEGMAQMGFLGVALPKEQGGMGGSFLDLCVLLEQAGRHRVPGPLIPTLVLGALPIARYGTERQRARYLGAIESGELLMSHAPGYAPAGGAASLTATPSGDGYRIEGVSLFVPFAQAANGFLVAAPTGQEGMALFLVDEESPGLQFEPLRTISSRHEAQVRFESVSVPGENVLKDGSDGEAAAKRIEQWGTAATCAEMVGGAARVLEMSVEYAKVREQFGKPIGSFQAVQHHCANMAVAVDSSRLIAYEAIWRLSEGLDAAEEVSMAKAWVSDAYQRVCALGHQVHGAIGFTHEHDLWLYFRHARGCEQAFGDAHYHREQLARRLGL